MSAHVLLNLLNELRKAIKCEAWRERVSSQRILFITGYYNYFENASFFFWRERVNILPLLRNVIMNVIT